MSQVYEYRPHKRKPRAEIIETIRSLLHTKGREKPEAESYIAQAMSMMEEFGITMADIEAAEAKEKAKEAPPDDIVSPPGHPMPNVRRFLAAEYAHPEHCLLLQQGGQFYRWDGTCWPAL